MKSIKLMVILKFFARDNKYKEVLFSGKRTVENIVDWLVNHATER